MTENIEKMTAVDARTNFAELVNKVNLGKRPIIVTRRTKPVAVVVPYDQYKAQLTSSS